MSGVAGKITCYKIIPADARSTRMGENWRRTYPTGCDKPFLDCAVRQADEAVGFFLHQPQETPYSNRVSHG